MTSNIGARFIQKKGSMGFQGGADASREKMEEQVMSQVKQTFAPEFVNRLDKIIIFDELSDDDLSRIIDLQVANLNTVVAGRNLTSIPTTSLTPGFHFLAVRTKFSSV